MAGPSPSRRGPVAWMASHRVAANLLLILILGSGLLLSQRIEREVFPEVELDLVVISVPYPGATPEEVEDGVVLAIESAIRGIDGIDEVRSVAREGVGQVSAELDSDADPAEVRSDIESAVGRITSLPARAERPVITVASNRRQVISVILHGEAALQSLKNAAEDLRDGLLAEGDITQVEVTDLPPPEIHIEIPQQAMRRYGLTYDQVAERVAAASADIPAGDIETRSGDVLIRTTERREVGAEFADIELIAGDGGAAVTVGDIGEVRDAFRDIDREATFNGERAVRVDVYRTPGESPLEIAAAVRDVVERARSGGETIEYSLWNDRSEIFRDRISLLFENAMIGVLLVVVLLGLLLDLRVAFWVTLGIPISFLGAFIAMAAFDVSLNMISMFAFILTLGIVVDDAIVAGEAIHQKREEGMEPLEAAIAGVREIAGPITFAVLTTITAFAPMLFIPGFSGELFDNIPLVVIPILVVSLVEAFFILPAHLAHGGLKLRFLDPVRRLQRRISGGLETFIDRVYTPLLEAALRLRALTLAGSIGLLILCLGLIAGGRLPFTFMPSIESDVVTASVELPFGTAPSVTRKVMDRLVEAADAELEAAGEGDHRGIYAVLGQSSVLAEGPVSDAAEEGGHVASVAIQLPPAGERDVGGRELAARWRRAVGEVPGVERLSFEHSAVGDAGDPIAIELSHDDRDTLERAAAELAAGLAEIAGVVDVDDGFELGKPQVELELRPAARALGLTEVELGRQVRGAFFGSEALRQQRGRDELRVYVRRPPEERRSLHDVENLIVRTPEGGEIPLTAAATVELARSFTSIQRREGRRSVVVGADVEPGRITPGEATRRALEDILPPIEQRYPALSHRLAGEQEAQAEALGALRDGMLVALLVMFTLMAVAFGSYVQPLVIMFAIPFGLVGAIGGHMLLGFNLSLISVLGLIALSGVVVNDSLVLIDAVNGRRQAGLDLDDALVEAGRRRFRPILLTSLTTFFGLLPMIFETSIQARFLIPMAVSLGFGVLFVTVIALLIVPCAYRVLEDAIGVLRAARERVRR